jgi:hypothetical protein
MSESILLSPVHFHGFENEILGRILEPGGVLTLRLLMSYIYIYIYIYDIRSLRVNDLTLILLTWRKL